MDYSVHHLPQVVMCGHHSGLKISHASFPTTYRAATTLAEFSCTIALILLPKLLTSCCFNPGCNINCSVSLFKQHSSETIAYERPVIVNKKPVMPKYSSVATLVHASDFKQTVDQDEERTSLTLWNSSSYFFSIMLVKHVLLGRM